MASWEKIILSIHLSVFCLLIIAFNTFSIGALNYDLLSRSFVRGKTYFVDPLINNTDVIFWQGRNYWPLGLLPGILLTPFAIGPTIVHAQRYLQFFVLAGIVFLTYKLTRDYHFRKLDSWWLIAAFFFGSILLQSISQPPDWYLAHNIGVFFGLLGIITTIQKKWLLAGISFGLASLARELMILGVIFPILLAWENISHWKSWLTRSIWILIPVITASGITIFYSYIRFGTFNPTYQHTIANLALINPQERNLLFHNGIFNFKYLPANFYYYFLATYDLITEPQNNIIPVAKPPYIKSGYPGISFFCSLTCVPLYIRTTQIQVSVFSRLNHHPSDDIYSPHSILAGIQTSRTPISHRHSSFCLPSSSGSV